MTAATMPFQTDPYTAAIGAAIVLAVLASAVWHVVRGGGVW